MSPPASSAAEAALRRRGGGRMSPPYLPLEDPLARVRAELARARADVTAVPVHAARGIPGLPQSPGTDFAALFGTAEPEPPEAPRPTPALGPTPQYGMRPSRRPPAQPPGPSPADLALAGKTSYGENPLGAAVLGAGYALARGIPHGISRYLAEPALEAVGAEEAAQRLQDVRESEQAARAAALGEVGPATRIAAGIGEFVPTAALATAALPVLGAPAETAGLLLPEATAARTLTGAARLAALSGMHHVATGGDVAQLPEVLASGAKQGAVLEGVPGVAVDALAAVRQTLASRAPTVLGARVRPEPPPQAVEGLESPAYTRTGGLSPIYERQVERDLAENRAFNQGFGPSLANERGITETRVVVPVAGAGVGAATGAALDEEHRVRGAIVGGLAGAGIGAAVGRLATGPDVLERIPPKRLSPEEARVQQHISIGEPERGLPSLSSVYAGLVRRTYPIERASRQIAGGRLPAGRDPAVAAVLASGSASRADAALRTGPFHFDPAGNIHPTGTPGLEEILAPLRGRLNELRRYEIASHTLDLAALQQPIETGVKPADAAAVVARAAPEIKAAHQQLVRFRNDILDYWVEASGFDPARAALVKQQYPNYLPLQRVFEEVEGVRGAGRPGRVAQPIKRLRGSRRAIVDPLESTVAATRRIVQAADRNRVALQLVELAETYPQAARGLVEPVATTRAVPRQLTAAHEVIRVWRNGTQEEWRVAPEIATSMRAMSPQLAPFWVRLVGLPARGLKAGVTLNPAFSIFNIIRDTFDATLQSRYGFRLGVDSWRGFREALQKGPAYREFRMGGGDYVGFLGGTRQGTQVALRTFLPRSPGQRALGVVLHPLEALRAFGRPFEEAARLGEFMRARQAGASVLEATRAAQDVTTNFQMTGQSPYIQGLAQITAFLNPAVQSLDTAFRVARNHPGRLAALGVGAVALPSALFWAASRDDQEIQDLRKTNAGLLYWFVRLPNGQVGRIPKPFLWGQIFGTGMEATLDRLADDDPAAIGRWTHGIGEQAGSNVLPNAVQTYYALQDNREPFFRTPIVPPELEQVEPRYQSQAGTGTIARAVGDLLNVSPAKVEFLTRQLGGTLASEAMKAANRVVDWVRGDDVPAPTPQAVDAPIVGRFVARLPSTAVEPLRTFYDRARHVREAVATLRYLKQNDPLAFVRYATTHQDDLARAGVYDAASKELSRLRNLIDATRRLRKADASAEQKRAMIDGYVRQMVELARNVNAALAGLPTLAEGAEP